MVYRRWGRLDIGRAAENPGGEPESRLWLAVAGRGVSHFMQARSADGRPGMRCRSTLRPNGPTRRRTVERRNAELCFEGISAAEAARIFAVVQ
jgi:hypothetical protein